MPTPNHIRAFELRLKANWSSEDVVQMLTPTFVESVLLKGFAALEPTTKVRTSYLLRNKGALLVLKSIH